jgi:hypothetical protein
MSNPKILSNVFLVNHLSIIIIIIIIIMTSTSAKYGTLNGAQRNTENQHYLDDYHDNNFRFDHNNSNRNPKGYDIRTTTFRGDSTWLPNTGETNVYDTALWGLALSELLALIRSMNIATAVVTVLWCGFSMMDKVISLHIASLVLSIYLMVLTLVLLLTEMLEAGNVMHHRRRSASSSTSSSLFLPSSENQSMVADTMNNVLQQSFRSTIDASHSYLQDNFGILYHPTGRIWYGYLLATLCWSVGGNHWYSLIDNLLGLSFMVSATVLFHIWISYPEYRRLFPNPYGIQQHDTTSGLNGSRSMTVAGMFDPSWSFFSQSSSSISATAATSILSESNLWDSTRERIRNFAVSTTSATTTAGTTSTTSSYQHKSSHETKSLLL